MAEPAIRTRGLRRVFGAHGEILAVDGVDIEVPQGETLGIVGPDGAGKTTFFRLLTGIVAPTAGELALFGFDIVKQRAQTRALIGYMSQAFSLYEDLTVAENIRFFASIRGVKESVRRERERRLLAFTRLEAFTSRLAGQLSGGMKQKLGLICTLIHEPRVLFLDEPTNGVDPVSRREFWEILGSLHGRITVVVATPYMDEADRCDRVALMARGRFLAVDPPQGIKDRLQDPVWELQVAEPFDVAERVAAEIPDARVQLFGDRLHLVSKMEPLELERALRAICAEVVMSRVAPSLEDAFVQLAGEDPASGEAA